MTAHRSGEEAAPVARNRQARFAYDILETVEAGIELTGSEIKSIRAGRVNLKEAFVRFGGGEAFLVGCHISPYPQAGYAQHEPLRERKLLLHKREIERLGGQVQLKGLTVIPTRMYFRGNWLKVELGLARGKKLHDKRETLRRRTLEREAERDIKDWSNG